LTLTDALQILKNDARNGSWNIKLVANMYHDRLYDIIYASVRFSNMADGSHLGFYDTTCVFG